MQKNLPARQADFRDYIGEGYFIKSVLEAILRFFQDRRHAYLNVRTDRAAPLHWVPMNRECRWSLAGSINIQESDLLRRASKSASAVLAAGCDYQSSLRQFREGFPHEGRVRIHTCSKSRRSNFLAVVVTQSCHEVRCYRKLNAGRGHLSLPTICDVKRHI